MGFEYMGSDAKMHWYDTTATLHGDHIEIRDVLVTIIDDDGETADLIRNILCMFDEPAVVIQTITFASIGQESRTTPAIAITQQGHDFRIGAENKPYEQCGQDIIQSIINGSLPARRMVKMIDAGIPITNEILYKLFGRPCIDSVEEAARVERFAGIKTERKE